MKLLSVIAVAGLTGLTAAQNTTNLNTTLNSTFSTTGPRNVRFDTGTYGPPVEEFHYYYDQWPIGLAVSKQGRVFVCYTRGTYAYTLGEIVNQTAEQAYPSLALNTPPGGLYNVTNGIQLGSNDPNIFISVQALYITPDDTLWVLDTGRPTINESQAPSMPYAAPGGPKLVSINLSNNSIARTYTLPPNVHYPDSYMNDLRFDMRANVTASGGGIAYIVDSSNEGRTGFIMIDLGTGESWRQLSQHPSTLRTYADVPSYQGIPFYLRQSGSPLNFQQEGLDGAELSLYGDVSVLCSASGQVEADGNSDHVLFSSDFRLSLLNRNSIPPRESLKRYTLRQESFRQCEEPGSTRRECKRFLVGQSGECVHAHANTECDLYLQVIFPFFPYNLQIFLTHSARQLFRQSHMSAIRESYGAIARM